MEANSCGHVLNVVLFSFLLLSPRSGFAADTISKGRNITDNETLVSADGSFTMGFFSPGASTKRYLGIRFTVSSDVVCWVANRDHPIDDNSGVLFVSDTGSLVLQDGSGRVAWSSNSTSPSLVVVQLLDTGDLVVRDQGSNTTLWHSFLYPQNVFLSGMKVGKDFFSGDEWYLTSWRSADDPSPGAYTRKLDINGLPDNIVWQGNVKIFRSGPWNGLKFGGIPEVNSYMKDLFYYQMTISSREKTYGYQVKSNATFTYLVLMDNGMVKRMEWVTSTRTWRQDYQGWSDVCDTYGFCGAFGVCNFSKAATSYCSCLTGYSPVSPSTWPKDGSSGCRRDLKRDCGQGTDVFLPVHGVKLPHTHNATVDYDISVEQCRARCLANCTCLAYAASTLSKDGEYSGCVMWSDDLIDLRYIDSGQDMYLRLTESELPPPTPSPQAKPFPNTAVIVAGAAAGVVFGITLVWLIRVLIKIRRRHKSSSAPGPPFPAVPYVDLLSLRKATRDFSDSNIIGRGGFGDVYVGKLPRRHPLVKGLPGRTIAVKRLKSQRGLPPVRIVDYFTREVELMSGLGHHANVLKFLAYCNEGNERILVYEYMHRKSLDLYIFGSMQRRALLDWERRLNIIQGIAKGVNHLSSGSVIHRDLKPDNVLLDDGWNAKVADFGTAKLLIPDATGTGTRIGTLGYVAPEYVQDEGQITLKCDVYSFGVTLLETLSGRKNTEIRNTEDTSLVAYAWKLWEARHEHNIMELLDSAVALSPNSLLIRKLSKCIQIGLLCVQTEPQDRPSMSEVVEMLSSTNRDLRLPIPNQPMCNLPALHEADTSTPTVYETVTDVNLRWWESSDARTTASDHASTSGVNNDPGTSGTIDEP